MFPANGNCILFPVVPLSGLTLKILMSYFPPKFVICRNLGPNNDFLEGALWEKAGNSCLFDVEVLRALAGQRKVGDENRYTEQKAW